MQEKYIVKNLRLNRYYAGEHYGFDDRPEFAEHFDTPILAARFIASQNSGVYQIEIIYIVE